MERFFYLDDTDRTLIADRRGTHARLGFPLQLTTARYVGRFLTDPLDVPDEVLVYLGEQLGIEDVPQISQYTERRSTPFEHQAAIRKANALKEFSQAEADFIVWASARAWNIGDGKKTIVYDGVTWLRTNKVLPPGVTTLARLVPECGMRPPTVSVTRCAGAVAAAAGDPGDAAGGARRPALLGVGLRVMPLPVEVPHRRMVDSAAVTSRRATLISGQNRRCPVAWL
ncbi:DUF4158 domain-containing protein [Nonomuraea sp. C10]|nr:DUF4158 domain-containing protein [Nonomuraea sp. C10]